MAAIRQECRSLFRNLPIATANLSTYRPRESSKGKEQGKGKGKGKAKDLGKGKGKGKAKDLPASGASSEEDSGEEGPQEMKWVMVRYPWEQPVPEEQERPVLVVVHISC